MEEKQENMGARKLLNFISPEEPEKQPETKKQFAGEVMGIAGILGSSEAKDYFEKNSVNSLVNQIMDRISARKQMEDRLAELIQQREELEQADQKVFHPASIEELRKEIENSRREIEKATIEKEDAEKELKGIETRYQELDEKLREALGKKPYFFKEKHRQETESLSQKKNTLDFQMTLKKQDIEHFMIMSEYENKRIYRNEEQIKRLLEEEEKRKVENEEIKKDKKTRPFLYYMAEKNNNAYIIGFKNLLTESIDLRKASWATQGQTFGSTKRLIWTGENEGFFEFSISGFLLVIKNVEELRSDKVIDTHSEKAIYKIISPDGSVVADDIIGYEEASGIFDPGVKEYERKMLEEFNNANN